MYRKMEDETACKLIALSVGTVMRQSLDDHFKQECKRLLGATSTKMVEENLYEKLKEAIQNRSRNSTQQSIVNSSTGTGNLSTVQEPARDQTATSTNFERNIPLSEIYCRTVQTTQQPNFNSSTSIHSTVHEEPSRDRTAMSTNSQRFIPLSEMYRRTIQLQKHSVSPQPTMGSESRSKIWKGCQSSAPF